LQRRLLTNPNFHSLWLCRNTNVGI
jgi:hypothetical protein